MLFILMAGFTTTALLIMNDLSENFSITSKMTKEKIKVLAHFPVSSCKFLAYFRDCITADKLLPTQHQENKHNHGFIRAILVYISNVSQALPLLWSPLTGPDKWGFPSLWTRSGCYHCSPAHNCPGSKPTTCSCWGSSWDCGLGLSLQDFMGTGFVLKEMKSPKHHIEAGLPTFLLPLFLLSWGSFHWPVSQELSITVSPNIPKTSIREGAQMNNFTT